MKFLNQNTLLKISFCLFSCQLVGQNSPSNCNPNDSVAYRYKDDADRLAIRHTYQVNGTYRDSGKIDQQLSARYLKALIAVFNSTNIPARDTVISWLNIHTLATQPTLREFGIEADSNLFWMKNFRNNVMPCGQATIDATLQKYGFQKTNYSVYPFGSKHLVRFDASYNFNSLPVGISLMQNVPGISMAGSVYSGGDGIDIWDSLNVNFVELAFYYRWGDCIAGCMYYKCWIFRVYNDCTVEYRGTQQNRPLPPWASIPSLNNGLVAATISPNPVLTSIRIDVPYQGDFLIEIIDLTGKTVIRKGGLNSQTQLDVSELPPGPYVLRLYSNYAQRTYKFFKL